MKRDPKRLKSLAIGLSLILAGSTTMTGCSTQSTYDNQVPIESTQEHTDDEEQNENAEDEDVIYVNSGGSWIPYYMLMQSNRNANYRDYSFAKKIGNNSFQEYKPSSDEFDTMSRTAAGRYNSSVSSGSSSSTSNNKSSSAASTSKSTPTQTSAPAPKTSTSKTPTTVSAPKTSAPTISKSTISSTPKSSISSFGGSSTRSSFGG